MQRQVTILGAGLVGSLLAILLRKRGYAVKVYERRPDVRKANIYAGKSINLAMSTRGWYALELAGIKSKLQQIAIPLYGREIHNLDGSTVHQPYGSDGQAIYSVSRGELNKVLITEAENLGAQFTFSHRNTKVQLDTNTITLLNENNESHSHQADLLIGSDGAFSSLRQELMMLDRANYQHYYIEHGYKELHIPALANGQFALKKEALHIWPRKNFMLIALPNVDGSFTCTLFFPFEGKPSFASLQTDSDIEDFLKTNFASAYSLFEDPINSYKNNPTSSLITVKTMPWVYQDKSLIIGDAAHAIVPFYGQGMNCGFEDCSVLINELDKQGEHINWAQLLAEYQRLRKPNADAVAQLALNNFIEMRDLVADAAFIERKKIEKDLMIRYPQQYKSVYEMVSFSHTPYAYALATLDAQTQLYQSIIAQGNYFDNLHNPSFITQLDALISNYDTQVKAIDIYG
jgi:kynurenine 3-monooxygenase